MAYVKLAVASAAGYVLYRYATRERVRRAAFAPGEGSRDNFSQVRNAGPEAMRDRPPAWEKADEASDESFPASDPPQIY